MQKHAPANFLKQYETHYQPLFNKNSTLLVYDEQPVALPYSEDFLKLHYHDCYEVGICLSGGGLFLADEKFFSVSKGDIIFIAPDSYHYSRSLDKNSLCLCQFVYYQKNTVSNLLNLSQPEQNNLFLEFIKSIPPIIKATEFPSANRAFKELTEACYAENTQKDLLIGLKLSAILLEAKNWFKLSNNDTQKSKYIKKHPATIKVAEYISLHYGENITARELAKMCHLSESQLRRQFISTYGMPPIAYRNRLRCEIAAELLSKSEHSITEISEELGYNSTSDFYRMFKSIYNIGPMKYRQLARKKSI